MIRGETEFDQEVKILLIGDAGVGKSSLARRFAEEEAEGEGATVGVDFKVRYVRIEDGRRFKVALWDTAGSEVYRALTASYYRGVQAFILVYDVCDRNSFLSLGYWVEQVSRNATTAEAVKLIIANKIDQLPSVDCLEGRAFAADHAALFLESSAKTGEGVKFAFDEVLVKIAEQPLDSPIPRFSLGTKRTSVPSCSC